MRALATMSLVFVIAACSSESEQGSTGTVPEQLEALEVAVASTSYEQVVLDGTLEVAGQERDYTVQVVGASGSNAGDITLHSPTFSDLARLDGVAAHATISAPGLHQERSILISDAAGPLYVADVGQFDPAVHDALGADFASFGPVVGTNRDRDYDWEYTSARFKSDTGDVDVLPGHTATVMHDGVAFRVGVVAAYKVTPRPGAALPCGGISDLLSYEVLRVQQPVEPTTITRPSSAKLAHLGCMSD